MWDPITLAPSHAQGNTLSLHTVAGCIAVSYCRICSYEWISNFHGNNVAGLYTDRWIAIVAYYIILGSTILHKRAVSLHNRYQHFPVQFLILCMCSNLVDKLLHGTKFLQHEIFDLLNANRIIAIMISCINYPNGFHIAEKDITHHFKWEAKCFV